MSMWLWVCDTLLSSNTHTVRLSDMHCLYLYFKSAAELIAVRERRWERVSIQWHTDREANGGKTLISSPEIPAGRTAEKFKNCCDLTTWSPEFLRLLLRFWSDHGGRWWCTHDVLHYGWGDSQEKTERKTEETPGHRRKPSTCSIPPLPHAEEPFPQGLYQHRWVEVSFNTSEMCFQIKMSLHS